MKKFLLAAVAISTLSIAAFAGNENSQQNGNTPDLVLPLDNSSVPKTMKKKMYYGESSSTITSIGETGNVNDLQRILEKGGNSHDVAPY